VSYAFWTRTASTVGDWLGWDWFESAPYFLAYFLLSQLLLVPVIYAFTRLDWRVLFAERRFKWLEKTGGVPSKLSYYSEDGSQPRFLMVISDKFRLNKRFKFTALNSTITPFAFWSRATLACLIVAA
jgi:hypothetical protein